MHIGLRVIAVCFALLTTFGGHSAAGSSGRIHVYPWTATLAHGVMSAPLPSNDHTYYYFDFVVDEHDVKTYASPEKFSVDVPRSLAGRYEYLLYLFGRAEHANGQYYFTGVYESSAGPDRASAYRRNTLDFVRSGKYYFDSSKVNKHAALISTFCLRKFHAVHDRQSFPGVAFDHQ